MENITKKCNKCGGVKTLDCFCKDKNAKDGYYTICKECKKKYVELHKEERDLYIKNYNEDHREERREYKKNYDKTHKEERRQQSKIYREIHNEEIKQKEKDYRENNKERVSQTRHKTYIKNKYKKVLYMQKTKKRRNKRIKDKYQTDPLFKMKTNVRNSVKGAFKKQGFSKNSKTAKIVGCDWGFLYDHLFLSFISNYDRYPTENDILEIDHIIPISTAKTEEDVIRLNHHTNFQWLLKKDNREKGDRLDWVLKNTEESV